ncbi:MAG: type secretion system protein [Betaproteobacteria bacterium]|nr:type secretion system protein [Betaproteobacteria bacterium]
MVRRRGFTLIELLVVMAIVATLLTLTLPRYFRSVENSRVTVLMENLRTTRDAIDKFYGDKGRYPDSLDELVSSQYLRAVPIDPAADAPAAWTIVPPPNDVPGKVYDIKSSAAGKTQDGRALNAL